MSLNAGDLLKGIRARILSYERQYGYRWPESIQLDSQPPEDIEFQQITAENVDLVEEWKGALDARRFRTLLNRGMTGLYAIREGRVIGFLWVTTRVSKWSPAILHGLLDVGEAMSGRAEIRPEYRRQKVGFYVHSEMQKLVRRVFSDQIKRMWGVTGIDNIPMQKLARSLGCTQCREHRVLVLLGTLFVCTTWDLVPDATERAGRGRLSLGIRVPDFLSSLM